VALQFNPDLTPAERADETIDEAADTVPLRQQRLGTDERVQPLRVPVMSSSVSAASPFGARSFARVITRQRLR
jgi:hypothetical protein